MTLLVATVVTRARPVTATVEVATARADHAPEPERRELSDVTRDRAVSRCDEEREGKQYQGNRFCHGVMKLVRVVV